MRAFDAEAHDYLVKPVTRERFAATMARLTRRLRAGEGGGRAIVVSTQGGLTVLPLSEIDWMEAAGNYARLWVGDKSYLLREALDALEARVGPRGFARAHRNALVRLGGVRALRVGDDGELVARLACGASVPVSRRRRAAFVAAVKGGASGP